MIWGYHYFWKHPFMSAIFGPFGRVFFPQPLVWWTYDHHSCQTFPHLNWQDPPSSTPLKTHMTNWIITIFWIADTSSFMVGFLFFPFVRGTRGVSIAYKMSDIDSQLRQFSSTRWIPNPEPMVLMFFFKWRRLNKVGPEQIVINNPKDPGDQYIHLHLVDFYGKSR